MAEREVKVKVKLIGEQVGIDPGSKLDELTKRAAQSNKELEGSYKQLTREEVDQAIATEKLTGNKSKLLAAFKGLRNDVPGLAIILNALKNPLTAIAAGFGLAKSAVDAYAARVNEAFARQQAVTRALEAMDFSAIARESAKAAEEWAKQIRAVASAAKQALDELEALKVMTEGRSGIVGKVVQARARTQIAAVQDQVSSGAITREEGARRIAAINERAEREGAAVQREAVAEQTRGIDATIAELEGRRARVIAGAPSDREMESLRLRAATISTRKEGELPGIEEELKKAKEALADSDAFMAGRGPISGFFADAKNLLLPSFLGGGPTESARNRAWRARVNELSRDRETLLGTFASETGLFSSAEARRAAAGKEVGEIDSALTGLRSRRSSMIVTQGLADSEAAALRPFTQAQAEIGFRGARAQDSQTAAQAQARINSEGGQFLGALSDLVERQIITMQQAREVVERANEAAAALRINDQ